MPWSTPLVPLPDHAPGGPALGSLVTGILGELASHVRAGRCRLLVPPAGIPPAATAAGRWHPHPELFIPVQGASVLETSGGPLRCREGSVVVIPAQVVHDERVEATPGPFANLVLAVIDGRLTYHLGMRHPQDPAVACMGSADSVPVPDGFGLACLEQIRATSGELADAGSDLATGALIAFTGWARLALAARAGEWGGVPERIRRIRWLVINRLGWPDLSVESLARELGLHPDHLTRQFKAETGGTLVAFIRQQRILHAQALLAEQPDLAVRDIAGLCGFADSAYFSKVFQQACGDSPAAWRRRHQAARPVP